MAPSQRGDEEAIKYLAREEVERFFRGIPERDRSHPRLRAVHRLPELRRNSTRADAGPFIWHHCQGCRETLATGDDSRQVVATEVIARIAEEI
jgi:hypothetical protein